MSEALDEWYQRELDYFRHTSAEFADRFPKIANRLNLGGSDIRDPHVERLVQAFAYLNARIRHKLDDSFPELANAMLDILYPHMVTPVPSMSVIRFGLNPAQKDLTTGHRIPAGRGLETEAIHSYQCRFRTCYDVELYPLSMDSVRLLPQPFSGPSSPQKAAAEGVLRFEINPFDPEMDFSSYTLNHFRFYININNYEKAARLLEYVLTQSLEVVFGGDDGTMQVLPADCIRQVGFAREEAVIPDNPRSFPGYRLLTEYFVLPQKFLFFDITGITPSLLASLGRHLQLSILLKEFPDDLENDVSKDTVLTGCTPVINLFEHTADAIPLRHRSTEYRILPDARAEDSMEIHSVTDVRVEDEHGDMRPFRRFYSVDHSQSSDDVGYWHVTRRPGPVEGDPGALGKATESWISLVDPRFTPQRNTQGRLYASVLCFNRDLPEELARQRSLRQIRFDIVGGRGPVSLIECVVPPTATQRRHLGRRNLWPLVSQLSLNHLTLQNSADAVRAFREILVINDVRESRQTRNLIEGLKSVSSRSIVQRLGSAFVRGTEVSLLFEDENFTGDSVYLFASILNRFLAQYTTINSFTKLRATTSGRQAQQQDQWTWPPQTGNKALI